jgi:hypothetical protein
MTDKEAMKLALEALELLTGAWQTFDALDYGGNAIAALKERLADPMREVQRLGQEIEQEPQDWKTPPKEDAPLVKWAKEQTTPPQRTEQNFCSRCGKRTNDIHTCTPPKENT